MYVVCVWYIEIFKICGMSWILHDSTANSGHLQVLMQMCSHQVHWLSPLAGRLAEAPRICLAYNHTPRKISDLKIYVVKNVHLQNWLHRRKHFSRVLSEMCIQYVSREQLWSRTLSFQNSWYFLIKFRYLLFTTEKTTNMHLLKWLLDISWIETDPLILGNMFLKATGTWKR